MAEREKAFLDLVYLALTPRSPLRPPHKRGRSWDLDKVKLTAYARRFDYKPLESWLKANDLWVVGARYREPAMFAGGEDRRASSC